MAGLLGGYLDGRDHRLTDVDHACLLQSIISFGTTLAMIAYLYKRRSCRPA